MSLNFFNMLSLEIRLKFQNNQKQMNYVPWEYYNWNNVLGVMMIIFLVILI